MAKTKNEFALEMFYATKDPGAIPELGLSEGR